MGGPHGCRTITLQTHERHRTDALELFKRHNTVELPTRGEVRHDTGINYKYRDAISTVHPGDSEMSHGSPFNTAREGGSNRAEEEHYWIHTGPMCHSALNLSAELHLYPAMGRRRLFMTLEIHTRNSAVQHTCHPNAKLRCAHQPLHSAPVATLTTCGCSLPQYGSIHFFHPHKHPHDTWHTAHELFDPLYYIAIP